MNGTANRIALRNQTHRNIEASPVYNLSNKIDLIYINQYIDKLIQFQKMLNKIHEEKVVPDTDLDVDMK